MEGEKNITDPFRLFDFVKETHLASTGTFKYIAIEVLFKSTKPPTCLTFIRGDKSCAYHADILNKFINMEIAPSGLKFQGKDLKDEVEISCPGGGRICYEPEKKSLAVYGYSMGFGQFDHNIAVDIMKRTLDLPDDSYKISFEGY